MGLALTNEELSYALQLRLGHIDMDATYSCTSTLSHDKERSGLDLLKCKRWGKARHDALAEATAYMARRAGLHPTREPVGVLQDGTRKRPGDIILPTFSRGAVTALDFCVTNNKQAILLDKPLLPPGRAARLGFDQKLRKWRDPCARVGIKFIPMSVDVYGYWHPDSLGVYYEMAKRRADFTDRDPDTEYKYMVQLISLILQRENARILINHKQRPQLDQDDETEGDMALLSEDEAAPAG